MQGLTMADLIELLHRENTSLHLQIRSKDDEIKKLESRINTLESIIQENGD